MQDTDQLRVAITSELAFEHAAQAIPGRPRPDPSSRTSIKKSDSLRRRFLISYSRICLKNLNLMSAVPIGPVFVDEEGEEEEEAEEREY